MPACYVPNLLALQHVRPRMCVVFHPACTDYTLFNSKIGRHRGVDSACLSTIGIDSVYNMCTLQRLYTLGFIRTDNFCADDCAKALARGIDVFQTKKEGHSVSADSNSQGFGTDAGHKSEAGLPTACQHDTPLFSQPTDLWAKLPG